MNYLWLNNFRKGFSLKLNQEKPILETNLLKTLNIFRFCYVTSTKFAIKRLEIIRRCSRKPFQFKIVFS